MQERSKAMFKPFLAISIFSLLAFTSPFITNIKYGTIKMPYKKMGLTTEQAAAHLLNRFSFGATPGQIEEVKKLGLDKWLEAQLTASNEDLALENLLIPYEALKLNNTEIVNKYMRPDQVLRMAEKKGLTDQDTAKSTANKKEYRESVKEIMQSEGIKPIIDLHKQMAEQKVLRAAYSNNQLQELLTDFWFNHFNVSASKNQSQQYILTYERDAIRANALKNFGSLLEATAKHPAMLMYLDNATSVSNDNNLAPRGNKVIEAAAEKKIDDMMQDEATEKQAKRLKGLLNAQRNQGLNENYAREIMELHTLGVDGGYTQKDVTEVARALTGWTIYPTSAYNAGQRQLNLIERIGTDKLKQRGFVFEGDFMFRADKHDQKEKTILDKKFPINGGYEEGMQVIQLLATHPSTARFISKKIAARFICDTPSQKIVNQLATVFTQTNGDIKSMLIAIVNSEEFWSSKALREKIKSPFELVISSVRATNATVKQPFQLFQWCTRMGQKFYYYQAPTGFPDKAAYWINTGSLLNRMNFGLAFASEKIPGIKLNLAALNNNHEPESADEALAIYSKILLPDRNQDQNIKRLNPLISDKSLEQKLMDAAAKTKPASDMENSSEMMATNTETNEKKMKKRQITKNENAAINKKNKPFELNYTTGNNSMLAQVVGVIIGSPEFQRK